MIKLNTQFIIEHMDELIQLEDYLPFTLVEYDKQNERDEFLKSKNLLQDIQSMDQIVRQKCEYYEDTEKAQDSVIIEWINLHPELEGIISDESLTDYQNMKNNNDFIDFIEFLNLVVLPSEKKIWTRPRRNSLIRDDSSIQLPNFGKIDRIYEKYPNTLLADYLSYLV